MQHTFNHKEHREHKEAFFVFSVLKTQRAATLGRPYCGLPNLFGGALASEQRGLRNNHLQAQGKDAVLRIAFE